MLPHDPSLEDSLNGFQAGDPQAVEDLIKRSLHRLERLTRKMLKSYPKLARWEQTGDVLNNAVIRLHRALQKVQPESPQHFFRLASLQIRRELIDMVRRHFGPQAHGDFHESNVRSSDDQPLPEKYDAPMIIDQPVNLVEWCEFHERVQMLPELEGEVFNLIWYHGLTQKEAAQVLGTSLRTVNRRYQAARLSLRQLLHGEFPDS